MISTAVATSADIRTSGHHAAAPRIASPMAATVNHSPNRDDSVSKRAGFGTSEHRVRPQLREARVRHGTIDAEASRSTDHPAAGGDAVARRDRYRRLFAGHEGVVHARLFVEEHGIGRHDLVRSQPHHVARFQPIDRRQRRLRPSFDVRGERQERARRSVERDAVERLLLKEPADQQEEHQPGEGVQKPWALRPAMSATLRPNSTTRPDRDRNVERDLTRPERPPRARQIVGRAVEEDRQREREIEDIEQALEAGSSGAPFM